MGSEKDGTPIGEGMLGSKITLEDFSEENNSLIKFNEKMVELQARLEKLETACFDNKKDNSKEGGNENLSKFEELCQKYEKTVDDITFDYENMSNDELVEAFEKAFDETDSTDDGSEGVDTPSGSETTADGNEEGENNPTEKNPDEIEKDWKVVFEDKTTNLEHKADHSALIMKQIWDFSQTVDIDDVKEILDRQIACNMAIANEGIHNSYGANIGHVILNMDSDCVKTKAKAYAAAGSDARMNGCELPVVINSGSGNQGITCCVPVVVYAKELNCTNEQLYRALVLSNLTAIYIKTGIGTLSAFCGAVSAGAAAGAGIAYLHDGTYEEIQHTIVNALAILSGTICDGAKASCAAKIASSIDAGIMGYYMYKNKQQFYAGDGIVAHSVDETIQNIGTLGSQGMLQTNDKIIEMMISCD